MFALQALILIFVKLSVIMFYRRIFCIGVKPNWFNYATYVMLNNCLLWGINFVLAAVFNCGAKFRLDWIGKVSGTGGCLPLFNRPEAFAISDFLTDVITIVLPVLMVFLLSHILLYYCISLTLTNALGMESSSYL